MGSRYYEEFSKGIFKENPTFALLLGLCPTLGVTTSALNGMAMGIATLAVLVMSNMIISAVRKLVPDKIRIPAYVMLIATLVTVVDMVMHAYFPSIYKVLGIYIPLIVVNCIILARAESFAAKNGIIASGLDGAGSGVGFTLSLTAIGVIREILGAGKIFEWNFSQLINTNWEPAVIMVLPPGAFITIGVLIAVINIVKEKRKKDK